LAVLCVVAGAMVMGHPHFVKTLEAKAQGAPTLKLAYFTVPFNEANLSQVTQGFIFPTGGAAMTITGGSLKQGSQELGEGEWVLRARAKSLDDWDVLAIRKEDAGSNQGQPDTSKAIVLQAKTATGQSASDHLLLDIHGGHGETDGKTLFSIYFGPRTVSVVFD
jgi:hypothetical protein